MMMFFLVFSCFIYSCFRRSQALDFQGLETPKDEKIRVKDEKIRVKDEKIRVKDEKIK